MQRLFCAFSSLRKECVLMLRALKFLVHFLLNLQPFCRTLFLHYAHPTFYKQLRHY